MSTDTGNLPARHRRCAVVGTGFRRERHQVIIPIDFTPYAEDGVLDSRPGCVATGRRRLRLVRTPVHGGVPTDFVRRLAKTHPRPAC